MKTTDNLVLFQGPSDIYSTEHVCPFEHGGEAFESVAQYMSVCKERDLQVLAATTEAVAPGLEEGTLSWDEFQRGREQVMFEATLAQFRQNSALKQALLATGERVLANADPDDLLWGIGRGESVALALDAQAWTGKNRRGAVLERVRSELVRDGWRPMY